MKQKSSNDIAKVAYDLWEKGGRQSGKEIENWLVAEKLVMEQIKSECGQSKRHDEIRKIAYGIWEKKGKPIGQDLDNWLEAKRTFRQTMRERRYHGPWMMGHGDSSQVPPNQNDDNKKEEETTRGNA